MKKILFGMCALLVGMGTTAYAATPDGTGPWADTVVLAEQKLTDQGSAVAPNRSDPEEALGVAEQGNTYHFFALGYGGRLTLGFENRIVDGDGDDVKVWETTFNNTPYSGYPEDALIEASIDGLDWVILGTAYQDGAFDLADAGLECAKYIRITDTTDPDAFNVGYATDAYDVDGVEALNSDDAACELPDETAPIVGIDSPLDGAIVHGAIDISGSVSDDVLLKHYNLSLYPASTDLSDGQTHDTERLDDTRWCSGTVSLSENFSGDLCVEWDTTQYANGDYQIRLAARDAAGNRDTSDPYTGNTSSVHVITITIANDTDGDGVYPGADMCENTQDDVLLEELGTNRWAWIGASWMTSLPSDNGKGKGKAKGPDFAFTMEDVHGCGCTQILEYLHAYDPDTYGEMTGHYKFGCSKSIIEDFLAITSQ